MTWEVGDKALCVIGRRVTVEGAVYTVSWIDHTPGTGMDGDEIGFGLLFEEVSAPDGYDGFDHRCFRKIRPDEQEACEPEFVTLLQRIKTKEPVHP